METELQNPSQTPMCPTTVPVYKYAVFRNMRTSVIENCLHIASSSKILLFTHPVMITACRFGTTNICFSLVFFLFFLCCCLAGRSEKQAVEDEHICASSAPGVCTNAKAAVIDDVQSFIGDTRTLDRTNTLLGDAQKRFTRLWGSSDAAAMYGFFRGVALSRNFVERVWHVAPLYIQQDEISGAANLSFTVEDDLIPLLNDPSTAGIVTKPDLTGGSWKQPIRLYNNNAQAALGESTITLDRADTYSPKLAALAHLSDLAFGVPGVINIYATPPHLTVSLPPHTDAQDVFILHTSGCKRWKVYHPPPRQSHLDPFNRGKRGDTLTDQELGTPFLDAVLQPGDVLYVPAGFPHSTSTTQEDHCKNADFSVHATLGLDPQFFGLTYAHLRWSTLTRRGINPGNLDSEQDGYVEAMEPLPIGFLASSDDSVSRVTAKVKRIILKMGTSATDMPTDEEIKHVTTNMMETHLTSILTLQSGIFRNTTDAANKRQRSAWKKARKDLMSKYWQFASGKIPSL